MNNDADELQHLHRGEVPAVLQAAAHPVLYVGSPFPPEIFLYAGSAGGQQVVEVHHRVHSGVQEGKKPPVPASNKPRKNTRIISDRCLNLPCSEPALKWHDSVMVDMQEREMSELLLENEEE